MKKSIFAILLSFVLGTQASSAQEYPFEVQTYGSGEPVLLVPGFTCTREVWDSTVESLKGNYELHVFTLAGFGEVSPIEFPWLEKIKMGMEAYVRNNELDGAQYVGHSMGGTLGLWLAAENPKLFTKVISVDGLPAMGAIMFPNYDPNNFSYDSPYNQRILNMNEEQFTAMAQQFANGMTLNNDKKPLLISWMEQSDRETYVYGYTDLLKLDLRAQLEKIATPVTIIAATEPYGITAVKANMEKQFTHLKDYELIIAEGSAHFIMFDKSQWFNKILINQLN